MIYFILRYGEKLAFQVGEYAKPVLLVKSDGERLVISEKNDAISSIAGKNMERVVGEPWPNDERETYKVKYVMDGSALRFSTPESHGRTCVNVEVEKGKFRIVGGASIIKKIVGVNLASRIEKDTQ